MKTQTELEAQLTASMAQVAQLTVDASFMLNQVDWLSMTLQTLAKTLELPADKTMESLPDHAIVVMAELKALRAEGVGPGLQQAADGLQTKLVALANLVTGRESVTKPD